jgi:tyrosinase
MPLYRRNIACLSTDQLHDLREALAILFTLPASAPHSWLYVAGLHGEPAPAWCIHGAPGFLTWHRAYLLALEEALQCLNPTVTVPYWNWSSGPTTGVPAACASPTYVDRNGDTIPNPLYAGPLPPAGASMTSRRADIDTTTFDDLATSAQNALTNTNFDDFQYELNNAHGGVHFRMGGDMQSVPYAGFDPIFFLHHANVDRLWAQWQATHAVPLPTLEAGLALDPFVKPGTAAMYLGADMESTEALGYRYLNWCLLVVGPVVFEPIRLPLEPWMREHLHRAKLVLRATEMAERSAELRVFVGEPKASQRTPTVDNPSFAGSIGLFGMKPVVRHEKGRKGRRGARGGDGGLGHATRASGSAHDSEPGATTAMRGDRFDLQLDITAALTTALRESEEPTLTLVPVGPDGKRLDDRSFESAQLELLID